MGPDSNSYHSGSDTLHELIQRYTPALSHGGRDYRNDHPRYWARDPSCLFSNATVHSFITGTGSDIFNTISPSLLATEKELIFITCFWARSQSLTCLSDVLRTLAAKARARGTSITVRIGLSSLSLFQKLFQTSSTSGRNYPPSEWVSKLGLPSPDELQGLDLEVKSIFVRPFSVMHPKFAIIDQEKVWLPSCNVSWEEWFEGGVELSGQVVGQFVRFWDEFWTTSQREGHIRNERNIRLESTTGSVQSGTASDDVLLGSQAYQSSTLRTTHNQQQQSSRPGLPLSIALESEPISCIFLPSPHHINPRFQLIPWRSYHRAPGTPLNIVTLKLFQEAKTSIFIQSPNITCPPVLDALLGALRRGVHLTIITSERLMILEQLGTAGTTTARCMKKLKKRHGLLRSRPADEESGTTVGDLSISYFQRAQAGPGSQPVQSHIKLTIIDEEITVLGSGNMDRASWYTSQELGLALFSRELTRQVKDVVDKGLKGRTRTYYGGT